MSLPGIRSDDAVTAVQRAILDGLRKGGTYGSVHKEGGTDIFWRGGKFVRIDFGDNPAERRFTDEGQFLGMLREFCHHEIVRDAGPGPLDELEAWKRILHRMGPRQESGFHGGGPGRSSGSASAGTVVVGTMAAATFTILFAKLRATVSGRAPAAGVDALFHPSLITLGAIIVFSAFWLRRNWK